MCPYQLSLDLTATADVVIGDYNYAFDPERSIIFAKEPGDWAVVVDEAHQLTERGRAYGSPSISASKALAAATFLTEIEPHRFGPFIQLAKDITDAILDAARDVEVPLRDGLALVDPSRQLWSELSERIDDVALDYARVRAAVPTVSPGELDPWLELARGYPSVLQSAGDHGGRNRCPLRIYRPEPNVFNCCASIPAVCFGSAQPRLVDGLDAVQRCIR